MSLPDWYSFLKADAGVAALAADRIYPLLIPQHVYARVTQQPVIVFSKIGVQRSANYCETERLVIGNYQFDCYARKYDDAIALAEALRLALRDYVGMVGDCRVRLTRQDNEFELLDPEPGLYRVSSDWSIWYIEYAPALGDPLTTEDGFILTTEDGESIILEDTEQ